MADPARRLIKYFAKTVLNATLAGHDVYNRERAAIRCPIGSLNVIEQVARSISADRDLRQRAAMTETISLLSIRSFSSYVYSTQF